MRYTTVVAAAAVAALMAGACAEVKQATPAGPGPLSEGSSTTWGSAQTAATLASGRCGYFDGRVASRTKTTGESPFTAICGGPITLNGTAKGVAVGTVIQLNGSGTAVDTGGKACPFTVTGTAVPEGVKAYRFTYTGWSCLGPFAGSELIKSN